ncbi:MAG: alpha/beta hydrolase family protein [Acidobacteriota bacterium]|nr:alpha/beta hydrolase family protein [Acidobacteriota bacterium]
MFLTVWATASPQAAGPQGQVLEGLKLASPILGRDVDFAVYLPSDYSTSTRRYPVVYLLHGLGDDAAGWIQFGEVNMAADKAIAGREIPPMIIIMPDAKATWYINDYQGKVRYEDMFVKELIPFIDKTYRTRPVRQYRGISGLSMGGWGTLTLAMRYPELFSACAAFSAAVWTEQDAGGMEAKMYDRMFAALFGPRPAAKGQPTDYFKKLNPVSLAHSIPEAELKKVRYYIDCGDDDFLIEGNCALHIALINRKIPHEFRVRDGAHAWNYWRTGIVDGLKFIGQSFTQ